MYGDFSKKRLSYEKVIPISFSTLQIPILVKIFSYLENDYLLKSASLVCKHWRYAAMQPQLIKSFYVCSSNTLSEIFSFIRKFYYLHTLFLHDVEEANSVLLQTSKCVKCLKNLALVSCKNVKPELLQFIVRKFPNLEALNLEDTNFNALPKYTIIKNLKSLKSINLSKILNLQMNAILETILNCHNLEELHLSLLAPSVNLTDDDLCLIITNMGQRLTTLSIDARLLTSRSFEKLGECQKLHSLHISYAVNLSSEILFHFLHCYPPLKSLGFTHHSAIIDEEIARIFEADNVLGITNLNFTRCILLGDKTVEAILKRCKCLKKVILKSCKNITQISPLIKSSESLKYLNIAFCDKLEIPFSIPARMETLIIDENEKFNDVLVKMRSRKNLRIYMSISEYTDTLIRV